MNFRSVFNQMVYDMDVARSLGAHGRTPNEQRGFVTFAPTKVSHHNIMISLYNYSQHRLNKLKMKIDIDKTLSRLSHVSQIGLLLTAIFTIWYTVIPLYGKAVLEEQISEKTLELKHINEKLDAQYHSIKLNTLKDINFIFLRECYSLSRTNELSSVNYINALSYDPLPCLNEQIKKLIDYSLLNETDKLKIQLLTSSMNIPKIINQSVNNFHEIEKTKIDQMEQLPELDGAKKQVLIWQYQLHDIIPNPDIKQFEFDLRLENAKHLLYLEHTQKITTHIRDKLYEFMNN